MNVYHSAEGIFRKCKKRIGYEAFMEIAIKCNLLASKKPFAFHHYFYYLFLYKNLLKEYLRLGYITVPEYILSYVRRCMGVGKSFVWVLLKKDCELHEILPQRVPDDIRSITVTLGVDRIFPPDGVANGFEIYDIKTAKLVRQVLVKDKLRVLKYAMKHRVFECRCLLQRIRFEDSLENITNCNEHLIVDECMNVEQQLLCDLLRKKLPAFTVVQKGITYVPYCYHGAMVLVNNRISYDMLSLTNKEVEIGSFSPINIQIKVPSHNKTKTCTFRIGYLSDMGNFIINFVDKKKMDKIINNVCKDIRVPCSVSIHPQEREKNREYYENAFQSSYIDLRKEPELESYFNNISLLIGWYSTAIFQAFLYKLPVIVLDFFEDHQLDSFVNVAEGTVVYARNREELIWCINQFRRLNEREYEKKHIKAKKNLGIKY